MNNKLSLSLAILLLFGSNVPLVSLASDIPTDGYKSSLIGKKTSKTDGVNGNNSGFLKGSWRRTRSPRWWQIGARRGNCGIFTNNSNIVPLLPHLANEEGVLVTDRSIWDTASAAPQIYVYLPLEDSVKLAQDHEFNYQAQFFLHVYDDNVDANSDSEHEVIYSTTLELPKEAGIVSFNFAKDPQFPVLETGKIYQWDLEILCSNVDHSSNPVVSGWMQKLDDPNLDNLIKQASPQAIPSIYESANAWYETVSSLAGLIQEYPQDQNIRQQWQDLLKDVGYVDILVNVPLVGEAKILGNE